jgi:hypothetical protein
MDFPIETQDKAAALGLSMAIGFDAPTGLKNDESTPVEIEFGWSRLMKQVTLEEYEFKMEENIAGFDFFSLSIAVLFPVRE